MALSMESLQKLTKKYLVKPLSDRVYSTTSPVYQLLMRRKMSLLLEKINAIQRALTFLTKLSYHGCPTVGGIGTTVVERKLSKRETRRVVNDILRHFPYQTDLDELMAIAERSGMSCAGWFPYGSRVVPPAKRGRKTKRK